MSADFRGAMRTQLTRDWRVSLCPRWLSIFAERPIIVTLVDDLAGGWRFYPEPPAWMQHIGRGVQLPGWDLTIVGSRSRIVVPAGIYRATNTAAGAHMHVIGQGDYLEFWPAKEWDQLQAEVFGALARVSRLPADFHLPTTH